MEVYQHDFDDIYGILYCIRSNGCVIVNDVVDQEECDLLYSEMWDFFEDLLSPSLSRDDQETWRNIYTLLPLHSMLFQHNSIGQAQFAWNARQNERVVDLFCRLWDLERPEDLLVSFDGSSLHLPPEVTNKGWFRKTWFHTDQSPSRNELECVQGLLTLRDVNEGDATFSFLVGSNNYHEEFAEVFGLKGEKGDWYKLNDEETQFFYDKGCEEVRVTCPKGSMVLWDSRTIHCGIEARKGRKEENIRAVIYLCYTPRYLCTDANLKKKKEAFLNLRTTNHYPHKPKLFPKLPRTYGAPYPEVKEMTVAPQLTDLGYKLAGF